MPTILLLTYDKFVDKEEFLKKLNVFAKDFWMKAKLSMFDEHEIVVSYFYYEDIEKVVGNFLDEEALILLKKHNKAKVLRKVLIFINYKLRLVEIYRGHDEITKRIIAKLEELLKIKLKPMKIGENALISLIRKNNELKQAFFKNVNGYFMLIYKDKNLKRSKEFEDFLAKHKSSLFAITFKPRIKFLGKDYAITINALKSSIKFSYVKFKYRPRYEIRQVTKLIYDSCIKSVGLFNFKIKK